MTSKSQALLEFLTKTKTTPPNVSYEISCNDCTATYNGQTYRPLIKSIEEHEAQSRLDLDHNPNGFFHIQYAPAHHSRTTGHKIGWERTLTELQYLQLQDTRYNWISQNMQQLKRETPYPAAQTVPLIAVNSGIP